MNSLNNEQNSSNSNRFLTVTCKLLSLTARLLKYVAIGVLITSFYAIYVAISEHGVKHDLEGGVTWSFSDGTLPSFSAGLLVLALFLFVSSIAVSKVSKIIARNQ